jgi:hypothetical protein
MQTCLGSFGGEPVALYSFWLIKMLSVEILLRIDHSAFAFWETGTARASFTKWENYPISARLYQIQGFQIFQGWRVFLGCFLCKGTPVGSGFMGLLWLSQEVTKELLINIAVSIEGFA